LAPIFCFYGAMKVLTEKQKLFVAEYLKDFNGTRAATAAGYSKKTAKVIAYENLAKTEIQEALNIAIAERIKRTETDADMVLEYHKNILHMSVREILNDDFTVKPLSEWPDVWCQMISGVEVAELFAGSGDAKQMIGLLKKMKWVDKLKNLELLGKHVDVQAYKDKAEVDHNFRVVISPEDAKL